MIFLLFVMLELMLTAASRLAEFVHVGETRIMTANV